MTLFSHFLLSLCFQRVCVTGIQNSILEYCQSILFYIGHGLKNNAESSLPNWHFIHLKPSKRNTLFVTINKSLTQMPNYFRASVLRYANDFPLEMGRFFRRQILGMQNGCLWKIWKKYGISWKQKKPLYYMCKLMWNFARHCSQNRN